MILGLDTSNYTTSAALYDGDTLTEKRRMLRVQSGQRGLRQSDALFQHISALPQVLDELGPLPKLGAVCVSSRPRAVSGSYMPCFLAGLQMGKIMARALDIPFFQVSHQQGHLAAAILSAGQDELCDEPFLAWHVSGGTTELLLVNPCFRAERIGGTLDVCAGQIIDRVGVMLGLDFPCGPELELLSYKKIKSLEGHMTVCDCEFSLSGLENQAEAFIKAGEAQADIAYYILRSIGYVLKRAGDSACTKYPGIPLLCCGGVMANGLIREMLSSALFASPSASADNAAGVAYLGHLLLSRARGETMEWML